MATKKYLSLERLTEYDELIKSKIDDGDAGVKSYVNTEVAKKADKVHSHDDLYYTESEIDSKISAINTSISNITSGTVVVKKAEQADTAGHAGTADSATNASHATSADSATSATKATQDASGNVITETYETKSDASSKLAEAKQYTDNAVSGKADSNHNHDDKYDAKNAAATALAEAKAYVDGQVSGMATTTVVDNKISAHNTSTEAHSDIRGLISALSTKVNNFLDVDDTTTDELSEVLELINNNKGTLESLTSSKVNVADIVDNLTTANNKKVLSANQGVELKKLIDALQLAIDGKAGEGHKHTTADITDFATEMAKKADVDHGTHVSYSTTAPVMDGTASAGSASTVARSDHKHPTDTSRASKTEFDTHNSDTTKHITSTERTNWGAAYTHSQAAHAPSNAQANVIESIKVNGTAQTVTSKSVNITVPTKASDIGAAASSHSHAISDITDLQTTLNNAANAISTNTSSISAHTGRITALETKVGDGFEEITSADIQALFNK